MADKSLTIGVDARVFEHHGSVERGIGKYSKAHLMALFKLCPTWKFVICTEARGNNGLVEELLAHSNCSWCSCSDLAGRHFDLFHILDSLTLVPGYDSPFRLRPKVPTSAIVYDLSQLIIRKDYYDCWSQITQIAFQNRLKQLTAPDVLVLAISESTRQDVLKHTGVRPERVVPIMAGLNQTQEAVQLDDTVMQRHGIKPPFFLVVGGLDHVKNFPMALNAFLEVQQHRNAQLVVVGSDRDLFKGIYKQQIATHGLRNIIFTGYLPRGELNYLYSAATGLLFPSLYEGFGLPALEAMANRCPVITSNISSLPEVVGEAAILVDPNSKQQLAAAMEKLLDDSTLGNVLVERGLARSRMFTWEDNAQRTVAAWTHFLSSLNYDRAHSGSSVSTCHQG